MVVIEPTAQPIATSSMCGFHLLQITERFALRGAVATEPLQRRNAVSLLIDEARAGHNVFLRLCQA